MSQYRADPVPRAVPPRPKAVPPEREAYRRATGSGSAGAGVVDFILLWTPAGPSRLGTSGVPRRFDRADGCLQVSLSGAAINGRNIVHLDHQTQTLAVSRLSSKPILLCNVGV